ncbi:MAG: membrane protein insertion efficiency factor YidD [Pontiellaceae bacterium]|nr:membrane protein insertion efficiency factor YidD [Pontiellaceae bacterium]MBN2784376.1 membrane protein insertion efficiency factor YidD [Pontiellaceae bacterium]
MLKKNIPTILIVGMFFFSGYCLAGSLELAEDLFAKEEWDLCLRECRRGQLEQETPAERMELLQAVCMVRTGKEAAQTVPLFEHLVQESRDRRITILAAYELGRIQWQLNQPNAALKSFSTTFAGASDKELFLHAACSLFLLMKEYPELKAGQDALISQISTSRTLWYGALFKQCARPEATKTQTAAPGLFIRFYRNQISPAIGARCNLAPSCSEYFVQAKGKHGWLAIPMIGDRFIREPDVNKLKITPVIMKDGLIRYQDLLDDHDFWMNP